MHEPKPDRDDTWFFLSAWPDIDDSDSNTQETNEISALGAKGNITLDSCSTDSPLYEWAGNDPWAVWKCRMAVAIVEDPDGEEAKSLEQANTDLHNGDFNTAEVSKWLPTRQIKTFHPRTPGMKALRDAVIEVAQSFGQL